MEAVKRPVVERLAGQLTTPIPASRGAVPQILAYTRSYTPIHVSINTSIHVHINKHIHICIYKYTYIYINICICICIYREADVLQAIEGPVVERMAGREFDPLMS